MSESRALAPPPKAGNPVWSVIVPAHQAEGTLAACLQALRAAGFGPAEILVVDDGSQDGTGAIAEAAGMRVARNETPLRPARARNRGVELTGGDLVLFVDADVTVHRDIRARLETQFADPTVTAVIGSYDDAPPNGGAVSRYRNLLHFFTHQAAGPEAGTFWTGLGAVRRAAFVARGGLDRDWENIEDVEFGLRLRAAGGRIRLDREIRGTHLKAWTLRSMFLTDLWGRAVPWTRLLRLGRADVGTLNTALGHRLSAAAVAAAIVSAVLLPALGTAALIGLLTSSAVFLAANARFLRALSRIGGPGFAIRSIPVHGLHYVAALAGYLYVRIGEARRLGRRPHGG